MHGDLTSRKQSPGVPALDGGLSYEEQKRLLQDPDPAVRLALARRHDVRPEILYYLASDASPTVRRAGAANPVTPIQADELLLADASSEVRQDLALKVARLLPDMPADEQERVRDVTLHVLQQLADDQLARVRAIVAEELKETLQAPPSLVRKLARDVEAIVAAPILEFSPLLSDHDFREIIAAGCAQEALCAIARRPRLSPEVADAVVATLDVAAVATLLANKKADIRTETLEQIADQARDVEAWHRPLVMRPELSVRAMRRISGFIATALLETLAARTDLDAETTAELRDAVAVRLASDTGEVQAAERERADALDQRSMLDDDAVADAIEAVQHDFVVEALSLRSELPRPSVEKLLRSGSGKAVTALAWQAGLSMRLAMRLQAKLARIPPHRMVNARHGTEFPLTPEEMAWQLEALA